MNEISNELFWHNSIAHFDRNLIIFDYFENPAIICQNLHDSGNFSLSYSGMIMILQSMTRFFARD